MLVAATLTLAAIGSDPALTAPTGARIVNSGTHTQRAMAGPTQLTLAFSNAPAAVLSGYDLTFTVHLYNSGANDASNVVLTVPIPAGTTFASAVQETPSGDQPTFACVRPAVGATGTIVCSTGTLRNGVGVAFDVDLNVVAATHATIDTPATAASDNAASASGDFHTYVGGADLSAQINHGRTSAPAGAKLTYTITVMNAGPEDATGVSLVDWVPSGTTLQSLTQNYGPAFTCIQATVDGGVRITCTTAALANQTQAQFDLVLLVDQHPSAGSIVVDPTVSATTLDPNPANNDWRQSTTLYGAGPPNAHTDIARFITATSATIPFSVEYDDIPTTFVIQYATALEYDSHRPNDPPLYPHATPAADVTVSHPTTVLTGLTASTTYHYRVVATNFAGMSTGDDATFTTLAQDPTDAPAVTTGAASAVSTTGATLGGIVNPKGAATTYEFVYGTTTTYGGSTGETDLVAGSADLPVHGTLPALSPATTYHYRLRATSVAGTTYGADATFTTSTPTPIAPTVETWSASDVAATAANIAGTFNPNGFSTSYWFEYGTTTAYGSTYPLPDPAVSGWVSVTVPLRGLHPVTTYHYRLVATNAGGTVSGGDATFTTLADVPAVTTGAASSVSTAGATLGGTLNPNGAATSYWFEYGTTTAYGASTSATDVGAGSADVIADETLAALASGATYHYRLVATNIVGTSYGDDATFTTTALPSTGTTTETPPLTVTQQIGATTAASIAAGSSGSLTLAAPPDRPAPSMSWGADTFPSGVLVTAETFSSTSDSTPPVLNGFAVGSLGVELDVTSGGSDVHAFAAPLELVFPNAPAGLVPSYSNDEGLTWTAIPLLAGTTLPAGQPDGYYRDGAGAVHILTRHATYFGLIGDLVLHYGNRPTFPVGSPRIFVYLAPERQAKATVTLATRRGKTLRTLGLTLPAKTTRLKIPLPHGLGAGLYLVRVSATSGPASTKATLLVRLVDARHR